MCFLFQLERLGTHSLLLLDGEIMAFLNTQYCCTCLKKTTHVNNKCQTCEEQKLLLQETEWNALSLEDKVDTLKRRLDSLARLQHIRF